MFKSLSDINRYVRNVLIPYTVQAEGQKGKKHIGNPFQTLWTLFIVKLKGKYLPMPIPLDFITYTVFGGIAVTTDILLFLCLFAIFKTPYINIVSYTTGTFVSFYLNAKYNFNVKNKLTSRYLKFWTISILGAAWSSWLIKLLISSLHISAFVAKTSTMPLILVYQYSLSKKLVYAKR